MKKKHKKLVKAGAVLLLAVLLMSVTKIVSFFETLSPDVAESDVEEVITEEGQKIDEESIDEESIDEESVEENNREETIINNEEEIVMEDQTQGLVIEDVVEGTGDAIQNGQVAVMHYTGTLEDGTKFDSSLDRNEPFQFTLGVGQVIAGWEKGILGMKVGGKRKLVISPEMGYGAAGAGGVIPPNATLLFDVELLEIKG